jgi:hypothetical protein
MESDSRLDISAPMMTSIEVGSGSTEVGAPPDDHGGIYAHLIAMKLLDKHANEYASRLIEAGYDTVEGVDALTLEELRDDFRVKKGHLKAIERHRVSLEPRAEQEPGKDSEIVCPQGHPCVPCAKKDRASWVTGYLEIDRSGGCSNCPGGEGYQWDNKCWDGTEEKEEPISSLREESVEELAVMPQPRWFSPTPGSPTYDFKTYDRSWNNIWWCEECKWHTSETCAKMTPKLRNYFESGKAEWATIIDTHPETGVQTVYECGARIPALGETKFGKVLATAVGYGKSMKDGGEEFPEDAEAAAQVGEAFAIAPYKMQEAGCNAVSAVGSGMDWLGDKVGNTAVHVGETVASKYHARVAGDAQVGPTGSWPEIPGEPLKLRMVLIGDSAVGKSCLLLRCVVRSTLHAKWASLAPAPV